MPSRYLIGGPSNSGKSTLVLTLLAHLRQRCGVTAEAIELDVWSKSFAAFEGQATFFERPKETGLDWDWRTPLLRQLDVFNNSATEIVLADLPGQLDEAIVFICQRTPGARAIVVSRSVDGLDAWSACFEAHGIPVVQPCLTFLERAAVGDDFPVGRPRARRLVGLNRRIDPDHPDVGALGDELVAAFEAGRS